MSNSQAQSEYVRGSEAACEIVEARKRPHAIIRRGLRQHGGFRTEFQLGYAAQMQAFAERFGVTV